MCWRLPILILLLLCASCTTDPDFGEGRITLAPRVKASFDEYTARDGPLVFVVTESGFSSFYAYCDGGVTCPGASARIQALDECRRRNAGEDCKIYAIARRVVWRDSEAARSTPQLSVSDRLVRACLEGESPRVRIDKCSQAIASTELAQSQKRGPFYVRGRAYEQIGSISDAERDYLAVLSIDPDHAAAKARLEGLHMQAALLAR
jgi:hypothetical protein